MGRTIINVAKETGLRFIALKKKTGLDSDGLLKSLLDANERIQPEEKTDEVVDFPSMHETPPLEELDNHLKTIDEELAKLRRP